MISLFLRFKAWCDRVPKSPTEALWRVALALGAILYLRATFVIVPWLWRQM